MKTRILLFKNQSTKTFLATLILIFAVQLVVAQTVHTVDNRPQSGAMYTSVQAAIDASVAGDIIQIHPSPTSYGNFNVTRQSLTLVGLGHNPANTEGLRASINDISMLASFNSSNNSIIKGLTINNITTFGTDIQIINNRITGVVQGGFTIGHGDNVEIKGNYFANANYETGIAQNNSKNWTITNNYFNGSIISSLEQNTVFLNNIVVHSVANSFSFTNCTNPTVANNLFLFRAGSTGLILSNSTITFTNCLTYSYTGTTMTDLSGANNFNNTKPIFENAPDATITAFYDNDYRLATGSPGVNGGFDGTDIGIFGRNFEFDVNGRPDLMPYPTSINIINVVLAPAQNLNVEFTASIKQ